jgi:hypothetical protein
MKKCILLLLVAFMAAAGPLFAYQKPQAILGPGLNSGRTIYHQPGDRTLSADTLYTLTGLYYVDSLETITIPAGTVIQGDTAATLIIMRGAKIYATGLPHAPIVFTSRKPMGSRARGDWGGVIILGRAPINKYEPLIEGGLIYGTYGGSVPNDTSGIFRYVRIEFPGYRFQLNNEINGLTHGGVGAGTEIHHIQVSYSFDDSYEWFGGTVNEKYLVAFGGTDDEYDTDFGYTGHVQYAFALRDPLVWDPTGESNGYESDNDASSTSTATPYTSPDFVNVTLIGPYLSATVGPPPGNAFQYGVVIRRSSRFNIYNSIIAGYPWGFSLRDPYTKQAARDSITQCVGLSMGAAFNPTGSTTVHDQTRWPASDPVSPGVTAWFNRTNYRNYGSAVRHLAAIGSTAVLGNPNLTWADPVTYRGAFVPGVPFYKQWTAEWTNFNPQWTDYNPVQTDVEEAPRAAASLSQNYPNPFNPSTRISFTVPSAGYVTLKVYDVSGKEVAKLIDKNMGKGSYDVNFNAAKLASGVYFYQFSGNGFSETHKMVLLR